MVVPLDILNMEKLTSLGSVLFMSDVYEQLPQSECDYIVKGMVGKNACFIKRSPIDHQPDLTGYGLLFVHINELVEGSKSIGGKREKRDIEPRIREVVRSEVGKIRSGGVVVVSLPRGKELHDYIDWTNFGPVASGLGLSSSAFLCTYSRDMSPERVYIVDTR